MDNIRGSYPMRKKDEINTLAFERKPSPFADNTYAAAFNSVIKPQTEFKIGRVYGNGHALVLYDNKKYIIASYDDLVNMIRGWLLNEPFQIPVEVLINVVGSVSIHEQSDFYLRLLDRGLSPDEIHNFDCALNISSKYRSSAFWLNGSTAFWRTIEQLDEIKLYGKCVQCLFDTTCFDSWFDKLVDTYISWGQDYLCEVKDGLFETVVLGGGQNWFYIYEVETDRKDYKKIS